MSISKATSKDRAEIMRVIEAAVADMMLKGIDQWDEIYPNEQVIGEDLQAESLYAYIENGILKGIIVLNEYQDKEYQDLEWAYHAGRQLVVHRLCIHPLYQGQGIAKALMSFAQQFGHALGYTAIRLDAFVKNQHACNFYEKMGYKAVGTIKLRKGLFCCFEKPLGSLGEEWT